MKHIPAGRTISTAIVALVPATVSADSGEGIAFAILFGTLLYANILWPIIVPVFFLGGAKKKVSLYIYSASACGLITWLLVYVLTKKLVEWRYPILTTEGLRVAALCFVLASTLTFITCLRIIPRLRTFNDAHD